jgi:penicillin-binding protein 2
MFLPSTPERPEERPFSPQLALRVAVLGMVALVAFGVLVFRLWALQVLASTSARATAQKQETKVIALPAPRGAILDSNGQPLVTNRPGLEVQVDTNELDTAAARIRVLRRLQPYLHLPVAKTERYIAQQTILYPLEPVTIAQDIDPELMWYLKENARRFPGVTVVPEPLRYYPHRAFAAHIFGQLGQVSAPELKDPHFRGRKAGDIVGQSGLEFAYDSWLRGTDGKLRITVDATGQPMPGTSPVERPATVPGYDLRTTIDSRAQRDAQDSLAKWIHSRHGLGANSGAMVVLDVHTGGILAMASYPWFDPNWLVSPGKKKFKPHVRWLTDPKNKLTPMLDRTIQGNYAPGSTFKPFTAVAADEEHVAGPFDPIPCTGEHTYDKHTFKNWDLFANSVIDLPTALTISCDTYFYELGDRIYKERSDRGHPLQRWAGRFSFGQPTGVDLPGESGARLPTPAWRRQYFKGNPIEQQWTSGDSILMAIGQGDLTVTPLQLAVGYAAIANGGTVVTPHLAVDAERDGVVRKRFRWVARRHLSIDPTLLGAIRDGLEGATHSPSGTASQWFAHFPIDVAGKTGTAEVAADPNPTSVFASYAPANDPKIAVVVIIPSAGHGGDAAAPAALDFYARYYGARIQNVSSAPDKSN